MLIIQTVAVSQSLYRAIIKGGSLAERLEHWTSNLEALSSSPTLTSAKPEFFHVSP